MTTPTPEHLPDLRNLIDDLGGDALQRRAIDLSASVRGMTHLVLSRLLMVQHDEKMLTDPADTLRHWVLVTDNPDPEIEPDKQSALTVAFAKPKQNVRSRMEQRVKLFVPVADEFDTNSADDISAMTTPDNVFVERVQRIGGKNQVTGRFLIGLTGTKLYMTPAFDNPEGDQAEWGKPSDRLEPHLSIVAAIAEDITTWNYMHQREFTSGQPIIDL